MAESPSAEEQVVELETVSKWDGESYVSALEVCSLTRFSISTAHLPAQPWPL